MAAVRISWTDEAVTSNAGDTNSISVSMNVLEFDAIERLSRTSKAEVTQFTVESGAPLTDHKRKQPKTIIIDGLVTNTPIYAPPPAGRGSHYGVSTGITVVDGAGSLMEFSREFDRVQDCFDSLQYLVENPIFVTLETPEKTYERVTVVSVEDTKLSPGYKGAKFTVTFQEIFVGETETVEVPVPLEPRGRSSRDEGASSTSTDGAGVPDSWALTIGEGIGLF